MKVLLISPLNPKVPVGADKLKFLSGEDTYTQTLLKSPPEIVNYIYFTQALEKGNIEYTLWQKPLNLLVKLRVLPLTPQIICFKVKGKFDLIHTHGHPVKISGDSPPVLLGDSSGNYQMLRGYLNWGMPVISISYLLKRFLYKALDIYDQEVNLKEASLVVWSQASKKDHVKLGINPRKITVIPPGIQKSKEQRAKSKESGEFRILFAGTWLVRKGGLVLLKAFEELVEKYPYIKLSLIGQLPKGLTLHGNIFHRDFVPRTSLMRDFFPSADVFVLVPPKAEGFGITPLEAASFGVPSIVSSVYALPEIVEDGKTGFIVKPGSRKALKDALETLIINPGLRGKMGKAAKLKFMRQFSIEKTNRKLFSAYGKAIKARQ